MKRDGEWFLMKLIATIYRDIWLTLTFKLDKRILERTTEIYRKLVDDINNRLPGSVIQMALQPFPTTFVQNSSARGGNMMGLEQVTSDSVRPSQHSLVHDTHNCKIGPCCCRCRRKYA